MSFATVKAVWQVLESELQRGAITNEMAGDAFGRMLPMTRGQMTGKQFADTLHEVKQEHLERAREWEI